MTDIKIAPEADTETESVAARCATMGAALLSEDDARRGCVVTHARIAAEAGYGSVTDDGWLVIAYTVRVDREHRALAALIRARLGRRGTRERWTCTAIRMPRSALPTLVRLTIAASAALELGAQ